MLGSSYDERTTRIVPSVQILLCKVICSDPLESGLVHAASLSIASGGRGLYFLLVPNVGYWVYLYMYRLSSNCVKVFLICIM